MMCCLFIIMVEIADDDPVETKPSSVNYFGEIKLSKVESSVDVKNNTNEAFVYVESFVNVEALHVSSGVSQLGVNKVDTTHFFSSQDTWKDRDKLLSLIHLQENKAGFTVVTERSSIKNPMLELICERSGDHIVLLEGFYTHLTSKTCNASFNTFIFG